MCLFFNPGVPEYALESALKIKEGSVLKRLWDDEQELQNGALKAEQDLARIEVEAKQKITQAQAEAESIKLVQEALSASPDYVEYIKWNKWDGKLPSVMGGNSDLLIGIDELTNGEE